LALLAILLQALVACVAVRPAPTSGHERSTIRIEPAALLGTAVLGADEASSSHHGSLPCTLDLGWRWRIEAVESRPIVEQSEFFPRSRGTCGVALARGPPSERV
jgi:hypothetical protein